MNNDQILMLRGAFAAAVKYDEQYRERHPHLWKSILRGDKLSSQFNLLCVLGDYFAFWYVELKGEPLAYHTIAKLFFENLYP